MCKRLHYLFHQHETECLAADDAYLTGLTLFFIGYVLFEM